MNTSSIDYANILICHSNKSKQYLVGIVLIGNNQQVPFLSTCILMGVHENMMRASKFYGM